jgi:tRNA pseudouridine38-40 synthase
MVRIIVGTLVEVARGIREPDEVARILASCDRTNAGPTAPPHGLYLARVTYEEDARRSLQPGVST